MKKLREPKGNVIQIKRKKVETWLKKQQKDKTTEKQKIDWQ